MAKTPAEILLPPVWAWRQASSVFPRHSEICLTVRFPAVATGDVESETPDGTVFRHTPGSLSDALRTDALWQLVQGQPHAARERLTQAGAELGRWLYGKDTIRYLRQRVDAWSEGMAPARIELRVSREQADVPWELCTLPGIGPLATLPALTVVRQAHDTPVAAPTPLSQLSVELMGVQYSPGSWQQLQTGTELECIRREIEQVGQRGRFSVRVDPIGTWEDFCERCQTLGPPHIFHFAGHGLRDGRGLVFRGRNGAPQEIEAERVAVLLSRQARGRQTRLAFLNACQTAAAGQPSQPFGGLAPMLQQHGIHFVVGMQVPNLDSEARELAATFYRALAAGSSVDCAVQDARQRLFLTGRGIGWAFLSLQLAGAPGPLWRQPGYNPADRPSARFASFGHKDQRQALEEYLLRRQPMVVLIHGEAGAGHRHVAQRVQLDLEKAGNTLWRPVAELRWFVVGERKLSRQLLIACIARALGIADGGTEEDLQARLARGIADRCVDDRVLVIDLVEVLSLTNETFAEALINLVQDVFSQVMNQASTYASRLPVFLLLSVAYPRPSRDPAHARRVSEQIQRTEQAIQTLAQQRRLKGNVRVEVLPKLQQIDEAYVADFLEKVLELDARDAESMAQDLVGGDDNETILGNVQRLLEDWETR